MRYLGGISNNFWLRLLCHHLLLFITTDHVITAHVIITTPFICFLEIQFLLRLGSGVDIHDLRYMLNFVFRLFIRWRITYELFLKLVFSIYFTFIIVCSHNVILTWSYNFILFILPEVSSSLLALPFIMTFLITVVALSLLLVKFLLLLQKLFVCLHNFDFFGDCSCFSLLDLTRVLFAYSWCSSRSIFCCCLALVSAVVSRFTCVTFLLTFWNACRHCRQLCKNFSMPFTQILTRCDRLFQSTQC